MVPALPQLSQAGVPKQAQPPPVGRPNRRPAAVTHLATSKQRQRQQHQHLQQQGQQPQQGQQQRQGQQQQRQQHQGWQQQGQQPRHQQHQRHQEQQQQQKHKEQQHQHAPGVSKPNSRQPIDSGKKAYSPAANLKTQQPGSKLGQFRQAAGVHFQIVYSSTAWDLLDVFAKHKHELDTVNISTAFHRLAKHFKKLRQQEMQALQASPQLQDLAAAVSAVCSQCNCTGTANIAWAQATLQLPDSPLMPQVLAQTVSLLHSNRTREFLDKELSIICWAAAKEGALTKDIWSQLSPQLTSRLAGCGPQSLSNLLWSCAVMGIRDQSFLAAAQEAAIRQKTDLNAQCISNVAWSFSKLEHFHPTLTRALAEETIAISSTLGIRDVPQLAWALCTAFAAEATSAGIDCFVENQTTTYQRSFIGQGYRRALFVALSQRMLHHMASDPDPHGLMGVSLAMSAKAFVSVGYYHEELYDTVAAYFVSHMDSVKPEAALCLLMAFKQARHYSPEFLASFATQSLRQLSSPSQASHFQPRVIAGIATSIASHTLPEGDKPSRALVTALVEKATEQLEDFETQSLANTAWAFAVLGYLHPPFFRKLRQLTPQHMPLFNATELSQLYQVELVLRQEAPDLGMDTAEAQAYDDLLQLLMQSGQLTSAGRHIWQRQADPTMMVRTTQFQQNIANAVLGLDMEGEVVLEHHHSEYTVDIAVPGLQLAIEADGPLHFMQNQPMATGRTMLKRRSLKQLGWTVLSVPFYHWDELPTTEMQQVYMQKRLQQAGITCSLRQLPAHVEEQTGQMSHAKFAEGDAVIDRLVAESLQHGLLHRQEAFPLSLQDATAGIFAQKSPSRTDELATDMSAAAGDSQGSGSGTNVSGTSRAAVARSRQNDLLKQFTSGKLSRHSLLVDLARIKTAQQTAA